MIQHEQRYLEYIRQRGVGARDQAGSTPASYVSYLNGVSRKLGADISPELLHSEEDIQRIATQLQGQYEPGTIRNDVSAMRQYVAMVIAAGLWQPAQPLLPEEIADPSLCVEGAIRQVAVNAYERNPEARRRCIARHGTSCCICQFSFGAVYGQVAEGYIHVHHLRPLSEIGGEYVLNPEEDLRPVCPNCHAVLHRRIPAYSVEEVKAFLPQK
jgi:5-methylcytosine-specific restriction endonuclease McrA